MESRYGHSHWICHGYTSCDHDVQRLPRFLSRACICARLRRARCRVALAVSTLRSVPDRDR
jgi:hypothetical protein